jgi:hypothetical protein
VIDVRIKILPKTRLGWWSMGLAIAIPIFFLIGMSFANLLYESVPAGDTILEDVTARPALVIMMLAGMASGISACIVGLIAIIRRKDHALLVYCATLVGVLLVIFLIAEFIFPH